MRVSLIVLTKIYKMQNTLCEVLNKNKNEKRTQTMDHKHLNK